MEPVSLADELEKNEELKQEDVDLLQEWCSKQPHLPQVSDKQVALFLHSCHYSLEAAKTTLDTYFTLRTHVPEFFAGRDPCVTNVKDGHHVVRYMMLPRPTPEGYRVLYMDYANLDPSAFDFLETLRSFTIATDVFLHLTGTTPGFLILFNMAGLTLSHLPKLSLILTGKMLYYLQEAMPVRLQGIHYINVVSFMDKVLATMKPFMKKELANMLQVHADGLEGLRTFIPISILPAELGGEEPPVAELHDNYLQLLTSHKEWIAEDEKLRVDETRRPGKPKDAGDLFGIEGSFKKLEID